MVFTTILIVLYFNAFQYFVKGWQISNKYFCKYTLVWINRTDTGLKMDTWWNALCT